MSKAIWVILLYSLCGSMQAQTAQTIKAHGKISTHNGQPAENATIQLLRAKDSATVKSTLPQRDGSFEFLNVKPGNYLLSASMLGYNNYLGQAFSIDGTKLEVTLTAILLQPKSTGLAAVVVEAKKPFIEKKLDKMVVNVENSIASAGNSVLDVLERSPGVVVNQESSINLQGKQGVVVMLDGKPTPLSGADLITYLKGLPASNIATIEIITQPSARYDAAGNAGIINIKFKKDQRQGFNGSLTASYGQGRFYKPNASTTLNYRKNKWNLFGNLSHTQPLNFTRFDINRKFFNNNGQVLSVFDQSSFIKQPIRSNNIRAGADFYASKKTIIGVLINLNDGNYDRDGKTISNITTPSGQLDYTTRTSILMKDKRFNGFGNLNFKHIIDTTGKELTADIDYGVFNASTVQDVLNADYDENNHQLRASQLNTDQKGDIKVRSVKADYIHPVGKTAKWEAGIKSSIVTSDNDVKFFDVLNGTPTLDPTRSNHFVYDENVNAAYASFAKEYKTFDMQVGLRMEHTNTKGVQLATGEKFSRNYVNLFPSIAFNRKFSSRHQLSYSYAKRIDRPSYRQLNPFKIFVDPYTYVVGDPTLKPMFTHVNELTHTFKGKYMTTLSYSRTSDVITDVFVQDDGSKISYQTPANLQHFDIWNLRLFIPFNIKNWMNSNFSGNVYWNKYESPLQGGNLVNDYASWDIRLHNTFVLGKKGWSAELNGFYQAKNAWGLFVIKQLAQVTAGIQKVSKNKNSTFKLAVSDIFYTNRIAVIVKYQNMDFFTNRNWDSRVATLSFTHRFGKNTVARARQRNSGVEDIKQRAN